MAPRPAIGLEVESAIADRVVFGDAMKKRVAMYCCTVPQNTNYVNIFDNANNSGILVRADNLLCNAFHE